MVAVLGAWHEHHEVAAQELDGVTSLPGHALLESYSVLTRLPGGLAVPARIAARELTARFAGEPLHLSPGDRAGLLRRLADAGVLGGACYDGLVALEAAAHGYVLLTLDRRAIRTYERLGIHTRVIAT
ncbi:MAG: PIN domain-containing protein [Candidatus Dormiibacterota bacterium]